MKEIADNDLNQMPVLTSESIGKKEDWQKYESSVVVRKICKIVKFE